MLCFKQRALDHLRHFRSIESTVMMNVNQQMLKMETDTGATVSLISKKMYQTWLGSQRPQLCPSSW